MCGCVFVCVIEYGGVDWSEVKCGVSKLSFNCFYIWGRLMMCWCFFLCWFDALLICCYVWLFVCLFDCWQTVMAIGTDTDQLTPSNAIYFTVQSNEINDFKSIVHIVILDSLPFQTLSLSKFVDVSFTFTHCIGGLFNLTLIFSRSTISDKHIHTHNASEIVIYERNTKIHLN